MALQRWRRVGIQARFLWLLLLVLLLVAGVSAVLLRRQQAAHAELAESARAAMQSMAAEVVRQRGEAIARLLADALTNPLYYFDLQAVGDIVRSALAQPDIAYVLVFDAEGRIVHDGSIDIVDFGQPMRDDFAWEAVRASQLHSQRGEDLVDVSLPIAVGDEKLGGVRVGLGLSGPRRIEAAAQADLLNSLNTIGQARERLLWGGFAFMVLAGVATSWLISRILVRPLLQLVGAARAIAAGNFRPQLPGRRGDEIGELERAFVTMGEALERQDAEIRRVAYNDHLTGLPNRVAFREHLDRVVLEATALGTKLALIFIDVDDFKRINDSLGHDAGDQVLEQLALRLRSVMPPASVGQSVVARLSGDEFVAVLDAQDPKTVARQRAEELLVELQRPMLVNARQVFLGASIGIAVFPDDAHTASALLKNGDVAMYQAKMAGKNCVRWYSRSMDQHAAHQLKLEQALRGAWERGELSLSFQPIYGLADRRLLGAEALLRWTHPELGEIPPSVFVEVAEQSGLIDVIGEQVLLESCRVAARWPGEGLPPFVSVNVSARQLRLGDLPERVAAVLHSTGLAPERLHVELTETAVLGDEIQAGALLGRLRALGVKIWLDDFGTGFSGLSHLRRVPVDGLKIDKSFVADVLRDPDDLALTTAIIAMAHSLGITVVAEGVENEAQFDLLRARGCDYAQGYWLGRAVPDAEIVLHMGS